MTAAVWHDLRKDPNDTPADTGAYLDRYGDRVFYNAHLNHWVQEGRCVNIDVWCKVPRFEDDV